MSDNKKYYYLKLKDTFFDSEEMKILESQKNGILYQNIYLKMCLLSVKNNGALTFKDVMPYDVAMLSTILRIDIDSVKTAIEIFIKLGLVVVSDNETMYMADIQSLIGQSSTEADRIKEYRNKLKCTNEVQMLQNCTPEIEKEIEIDTEIEKDTDNIQSNDEENTTSSTKYEFITKDGIYTLSLTDYEYFKKGYKNINVDKELEKMVMWCYSNDQKRKTNRGMKKFINNWLSRAIPTPSPIEHYEETEEQKYFKKLLNNGVENEKVNI